MKKKKEKEKKIYHSLTIWLAVVVLGTIIGISIQFSRAWVEPSLNAPDGNIAAPINTGATEQTKVGKAGQKADICVDAYGNGDKKCLSELISFPACTLAGGMPTTVGAVTLCKFPGSSCASGWTQYLKYTETSANTCTGGGGCGTSVTSGSHTFNNINPVTEARPYSDGNQTSYECNCTSVCVNPTCCLYDSVFEACYSCCNAYSTVCGTCTSCGAGNAKTCNSTVTAVGCVQ